MHKILALSSRSTPPATIIGKYSRQEGSGKSIIVKDVFNDNDLIYAEVGLGRESATPPTRIAYKMNVGPQSGTASNNAISYLYALAGAHQVSALSTGPLFYRTVGELTAPSFPQLLRDISVSMEQDPVLDGFRHPAEALVAKAFTFHSGASEEWAMAQITHAANASFAADILRLLCRFVPSALEWRQRMVSEALKSPSIEIRDAAIQAIESWTDPHLISILQKHREGVPWLAKYAAQVVRDLS